jgi:hypothetical protein
MMCVGDGGGQRKQVDGEGVLKNVMKFEHGKLMFDTNGRVVADVGLPWSGLVQFIENF